MIASIRGTIQAIEQDSLVIETNGIGYQVHTTQDLLSHLEVGQSLFIHTVQHIREDAHMLFGFLDLHEKSAFVTLQGVTGIGPKASLAILNAIRPGDLAQAIQTEDVTALTELPGVGKKTAQRLIVELKDKFIAVPTGFTNTVEDIKQKAIPQKFLAEVTDTLLTLGYQEREVRDVLKEVRKQDKLERTVEAWVRQALREFTRL